MTKEIAIRQDYSALDAAMGSALDDATSLRFKGGAWQQGFGLDKTDVELGTVFRFAPDSIQDGFVKWDGGKPVDWRMREWAKPSQPIFRDELGSTDETAWVDGKDPWSYTLVAAFKDAGDTLYKFTTSSAGGTNAIKRLLRDWRKERDKHHGLVPVVALGSDKYEHKVHRTTIQVPTFEIVGWERWDENAPPPPTEKRAQVAAELNDEVPF